MLDNQEQEEAELRFIFGEALSEYLQGYTYEQGPAIFDTLETASLNLGDNVPRQGFKKGGGLPSLSLSNMASNVTSNPVGMATTAASTAASIALGANPVVGLVGNTISLALTGKTISENLGVTPDLFSSPTGLIGGLDIEIENPATGQITTRSGRQAIQDSQRGTPDLSFSPNLTSQLSITGSELSAEGPPDTAPPGRSATPQIGIEAQELGPPTEASAEGPTAPGQATAAEQAQSVADAAAELGIGDSDAAGAASAAAADAATGGAGAAGGTSGQGEAEGGVGSVGAGILAKGGQIKGYQEGSLVEDDQADTQLDILGLGPIGIVDDPDGTTGVADDLEMELPVNSYVLNAESVELAGVVSINKMIKEAIDLAMEDNVDLPSEIKTAEKIPIKISRGEAVIPGILVKYIGLEKLEKMNNRGLKAREQRENEEAPVEMAAAPSAQEDLLAQIQPVA